MTSQRARQAQVRGSAAYDDTLPAGVALENNETLQEDLNALRSQVRRILHGDAAGNWYDNVPQVDGTGVGLTSLSATVVRPYTHVQAAPAITWVVNHNLGFRPVVQLFSTGGLEIEADVQHVSDFQCVVSFGVAVAGSARCS